MDSTPPTTSQFQEPATEPEQPRPVIASTQPPLDLTIPPAPVMPTKVNKALNFDILPKPGNLTSSEQMLTDDLSPYLPPPPPAPDFTNINPLTDLPTDPSASLTPPPMTVANTPVAVSAVAPSSDPTSFHIPV